MCRWRWASLVGVVVLLALGAVILGRTILGGQKGAGGSSISMPPSSTTRNTGRTTAPTTAPVHTTTAHVTTTTAPVLTTTVEPSSTTTTTTTTTTPGAGPTLANCTASVTGFYFPDQTPAVQMGRPSTVQRIGYACENQVVLSEAMKAAGDGTVYNGDVLTMAQDVCKDYPSSPLCRNG